MMMSLPRLIQASKAVADANLGRWLRNAVRRLSDGQEAAKALSLSGPAALDERDRHLRSAAKLIAPDSSDWRAAGELLPVIRYTREHMPVLADRYPDLPPDQCEIVAALLCGPVPESRRRIYDCLADNRTPTASEIGP